MIRYLPLILLLVCLSTSCATVFTGTTDEVYFTSEPSGALIVLDNHVLGRTPLITRVPRRLSGGRYLSYELEGYETATQLMKNRVNGITFINLLWWPGFIVDAVSGAMTKIGYNTYYMELYPLPEGIRAPRG